jgi:hypothetical protein
VRTQKGLVVAASVAVLSLLIARGAAPAGGGSSGQNSYQKLVPGQSTKADVERVLGRPVSRVSETLYEYGPRWSAKKIYVQYGKDSAVVERIEVLLTDPVGRSDALMYVSFTAPPDDPFGNSLHRSDTLRSFVLSQRPVATRTRKGKLEEYFGRPLYMVLTHEGEEASSRVNQIGYYSRELFESATAKPGRGAPPQSGRDIAVPGGGRQYIGCFKDTSDFDLNGYLERSAINTPERCIQICRDKGFAYAGVQYGESCLCGNSYGKYGPADNCDYKCTGAPGDICGGYSANSVYATGVGLR